MIAIMPSVDQEQTKDIRMHFRSALPSAATAATPSDYIISEVENSVTVVSESELDQIENLYLLKNADELFLFLHDYPELPRMLIDIHQHLREFFRSSRFSLQMIEELEGNEEDTLLVLVENDLPIDEAISQLDAFGEAWWFKTAQNLGGLINIDVT